MQKQTIYIVKMAVGGAIAFLLVLWLAQSSKSEQRQQRHPYRVEEFSIAAPGELHVRTSGGNITVIGDKNGRVRVEMYVQKDGKLLQPADTDLDDFDIQILKKDHRIVASAKRKDKGWKFWQNNNFSISFVVHAPKQMSSELRTSGGFIEASALKGNQQIRTSGGHLKLTNLRGDIKARTSGGSISIDNVHGKLEARTSGGHISARGSNGMIDVRTSGGRIRLDNVSGSIAARTSGGGITATLNHIKKYARLRTSGGNVDITVPAHQGFDLHLKGTEVHSQLQDFSGSMEDDRIEGTINGGGSTLMARTSGGDVRLHFAD